MSSALTCIFYAHGAAIIFAFLFAVSEWIGNNKKIKQNSIYQIINTFLKSIVTSK